MPMHTYIHIYTYTHLYIYIYTYIYILTHLPRLSCVCLSVSVCLFETDLVRAVEAGKIDVGQTHWCTPVFSGFKEGANHILIQMVTGVGSKEVGG